MSVSVHPMVLRAGLALAVIVATLGCDSPTIPPVEEEDPEKEDEDPGDSIKPRAGRPMIVEIVDSSP